MQTEFEMTGKEQFIAIEESPTSRDVIQFIMDNLKVIAPNDGRKTYFLTQLLPLGTFWAPGDSNKTPLKNTWIMQNISERESAKTTVGGNYTLKKLFQMLHAEGIFIESIEYQDKKSRNMYMRLPTRTKEHLIETTNRLHSMVVDKMRYILNKDTSARILIFTHPSLSEKGIESISQQLTSAGYSGICINRESFDAYKGNALNSSLYTRHCGIN